MLRLTSGVADARTRNILPLGLVIGLTMGVRVGGAILLIYLAIIYLLSLIPKPATANPPLGTEPKVDTTILRASLQLALISATAYATMLLVWPTALLNPLTVPIKALALTSNSTITESILWNGVRVLSTDLPWNYLPVLFGVELPEVTVLLTVPALLLSLSVAVSNDSKHHWQLRIYTDLLLFSVLFPILWAIGAGSTIYDNARHFLFVLPPLMILCANLITTTFSYSKNRKWLTFVIASFLVVGLGYSTFLTASLHPYEYVYKNSFAGGMPEAEKKFETDYWLTSYREAFQLVESHARKIARERGSNFEEMNFSVAVFGEPGLAEEELPPQFKAYFLIEDNPARADFLVAPTRRGANLLWGEYPEIGTVGRLGMTFSVVKASPGLAISAGNTPF